MEHARLGLLERLHLAPGQQESIRHVVDRERSLFAPVSQEETHLGAPSQVERTFGQILAQLHG